MPNIVFKGVKIHYAQRGKGPAVVLLHGFLEASWMWKDIVPQLSKSRRVITIDLPGHGKSECIGYVHTMDEMAEVVKAVMQALKIRKIDLIGHSMGGYVALAFAERFPDELRSLVLYQSTSRSDSAEGKKGRDRAVALVKERASTFVRQSIPLLFRPVNRKRFRTQINEVKLRALETPVQGVIAALGGMRDRPNRELLLKFPPYPVHLIAGEKDPRIPLQELIEQAEISESVHLHVLEGCGHMSYIEDLPNTLRVFKEIL